MINWLHTNKEGGYCNKFINTSICGDQASNVDVNFSFSHEMEGQIESSPNTLVQCRICHDEDEDSNMEAPCSCCGTLKARNDIYPLLIAFAVYIVCKIYLYGHIYILVQSYF